MSFDLGVLLFVYDSKGFLYGEKVEYRYISFKRQCHFSSTGGTLHNLLWITPSRVDFPTSNHINTKIIPLRKVFSYLYCSIRLQCPLHYSCTFYFDM